MNNLPEQIINQFEVDWHPRVADSISERLAAIPAEQRPALALELLLIDLERRYGVGLELHIAADYGRCLPELGGQTPLLARLIAVDHGWRDALGLVTTPARYAGLLPVGSDNTAAQDTVAIAAEQVLRVWPLAGEFGRYRIERKLGSGQMGCVYLAYDPMLTCHVALKVPKWVGRGAGAERFIREVRAAAVVDHPNVCEVRHADRVGGIPYYTMRYIPDARPLTVAHPPRVDPRTAAEVMRVIADAVAAAHELGIVHRDLKPHNILVGRSGWPYVTDFGLAFRLVGGDPRASLEGQVIGTLAYMAPEQAAGRIGEIDARADVWALGVILFELLTERLPFEAKDAAGILAALRNPNYRPPPAESHRPDLDAGLVTIIRTALDPEADRRYATAAGLAEALAGWLAPPPLPVSPTGPTPADLRFTDQIRGVLDRWGWDEGLKRLRETERTATGEDAARLRLALGWLTGERGDDAAAAGDFAAAAAIPGFRGWALVGQAFLALRQHDPDRAERLLDEAATTATDPVLRATIAHIRGAAAYHAGDDSRATAELRTALELFGAQHFATGRVLDTLGMVAATRGQHAAAEEFFDAALALKRQRGDTLGEAVTLGQRGRWQLANERLDAADADFLEAEKITRQTGDRRGSAQVRNHRGQVALARGDHETAAEYLRESADLATGIGTVLRGYALKDLALTLLAQRDGAAAAQACGEARRLFEEANFEEGVTHARWVEGRILRMEGHVKEATDAVAEVAARFEGLGEPGLVARCRYELADLLRTSGATRGAVADAMQDAMEWAERAGHAGLLGRVAADWAAVAPADYWRWVARRSRPLGGGEPVSGSGAVVFVRLGYANPAADAAFVLAHTRELLADATAGFPVEPALIEHHGSGVLVLFRHSAAVADGLAAAAGLTRSVRERNRPRRVMIWPLWEMRVAVAAGPVALGPIGPPGRTADTVVGAAVERAVELARLAEPGRPCLSDEVYVARPRPDSGRFQPRDTAAGRVWDWNWPE